MSETGGDFIIPKIIPNQGTKNDKLLFAPLTGFLINKENNFLPLFDLKNKPIKDLFSDRKYSNIIKNPEIIFEYPHFDITSDKLDKYLPRKGELKRLDWDGLGRIDIQAVEVHVEKIHSSIQSSLEQIAGNTDQATLSTLSRVVAKSLIGLCEVSGIDHDKIPTIRIVDRDDIGGSYNPFNNSISISSARLLGAYAQLRMTAMEKGISSKIKSDLVPAVGDLIGTIAHEIYHCRQNQQDPEYMYKTLEANMMSGFLNQGMQYYDFDQGEMAAEAFSLRALTEISENVDFFTDFGASAELITISLQDAYMQNLFSLLARAERKKAHKGVVGYSKNAGMEEAKKSWETLAEKIRGRSFRSDQSVTD